MPMPSALSPATSKTDAEPIMLNVGDGDGATLDHGEVAALLRGREPARPATLSQHTLDQLAARLRQSERRVKAGIELIHKAKGPLWGDPEPHLLARGDIQALAPGAYRCAGVFLDLVRSLDRVMRALSEHYGAAEHDLPPLRPEDLPALLEPAPGPTSGCHFALGAQGVVADGLFSAGGKVTRDKSLGREGIAGARICTRREVLAVGTELFTTQMRDGWLEDMVALVTHLDLEAQVIRAGEGAGAWTLKGAFQKGFGLHYAVCAAGAPGQVGGVPIMGLTLHLDRFSRAFDYELSDGNGDRAHAATLSVDLEPLAYAMMVRHGPDPADWPDPVRTVVRL